MQPNNYTHYTFQIADLIKDMQQISGEWDGDNSGRMEDRAHVAEEIETNAKKILELLEELKDI